MLTFNFLLQKVKAPAKLKVCSMFNILLINRAGHVLHCCSETYTDWWRHLLQCKNISLLCLSLLLHSNNAKTHIYHEKKTSLLYTSYEIHCHCKLLTQLPFFPIFLNNSKPVPANVYHIAMHEHNTNDYFIQFYLHPPRGWVSRHFMSIFHYA